MDSRAVFIDSKSSFTDDAEVTAGSGTALTKAELADILFDQVGLNKREAKELVDAFFEEIRIALVEGELVKLSGFGNFQLRDKSSRPGRNPKTGESIPISARRVVTFHASQKLKNQVQGLSSDAMHVVDDDA
ncbi:MAG: Integration host factor subunit alpha [Pseudomonadota bacterium]|jgi:integration host factor subunit alpha